MAKDNFDSCLKFVLKFEGGFVNDPRDPGGPTNLGVTQRTLSGFLGHPASIEDVKKLTPKTVAPIYRQNYWNKVSGDDLPAGVDLAVFDFGVHSGPRRGVIGLQRALGLADDGQSGPITVAAAGKADPTVTVQQVCAERLAFLSRLTVFKAFGKGLRSRVEKCEKAALGMIGTGPTAAKAAKPAREARPAKAAKPAPVPAGAA